MELIDNVLMSRFLLYVQQNIKAFMVNISIAVVLAILLYTNIIWASQFWIAIVPLVVSTVFSVVLSDIMSDKIRIMGLSVDYMLNRGGVTLDDVLGVLISYKVRKKVTEPTKAFFEPIKHKCTYGTPEERRRIAEALPGLYRLNKKETLALIKNKLRIDYDDGRWTDDNRRRTIEALWYLPKTKKVADFIKAMLSVKERDSIFTIIAITELICFSRKFNELEQKALLSRLKTEVIAFFPDTTTSIGSLIDNIINFSSNIISFKGDIQKGLAYIHSIFDISSENMKIVIAKNIILISKKWKRCLAIEQCKNEQCGSCMIELFDLCFDSNNHRYIRRPMARENVYFCLLSMLPTANGNAARERIMRLIKDNDPIISRTTFDYIHKVLTAREGQQLYNDILDYCINIENQKVWINENNRAEWLSLKERAEHVKDTVGRANI